MLTESSSAEIVPFQPPIRKWQRGEFEAWRESAHRRAVADPGLSHAATRVFGFVLWHVNRQSGGWALCCQTIADGTAIESTRHVRRCVAELEKRGYLKRASDPGHANFYSLTLPTPDKPVRGGGQTCPGYPDKRVRHYLLKSHL